MTCWETVGLLGPCALLASSDHRFSCSIIASQAVPYFKMVSIVLLTTEEVLQRNGYWFCLDTIWVTEEMEPFEEVKPEHVCIKPLTRDFYYAKHPDIPRSESEDENSLSLNGFRMKHDEWKTKIRIKKFVESRRSSCYSRLSASSAGTRSNESLNNETKRKTSLTDQNINHDTKKQFKTNDEKVSDFFKRLLINVPPPPIENLDDSRCITVPPKTHFNEIKLPEYAEFDNSKLFQASSEHNLMPKTSSLKKAKHRVSFNVNSEFEDSESWHESIYGISDLVEPKTESRNNKTSSATSLGSFPSWSEIINECGLNSSILRSRESLRSSEEIISRSHLNDKIDDLFYDKSDDEEAYAKFAIYKIYKTIKTNKCMIDSSSMRDLNAEVYEDNMHNKMIDTSCVWNIYSLVPNSFDEIDEPPPENELQKNSDRVLSEHELRVQRSLQKLNVPEWYKNAPTAREGFLLRKRLSDASASAGRWSGLNSKTTSLGSLGGANVQPPPPQLSPHTTSFGRWSTSRLNSNQTSPCSSTRSSIRGTSPLCSPSTRSSFSARQPYLGWRSQERLNNTPRTPHERLASSLLQQSASAKAAEEIQTSIKEVTSAIVHYVSGLEPANGDLDQPSPRSSQKLFWLESSFV
ncbi:Uncharacterized protein OBRU01_18734, partial [Operophtera brumata]